MVAPISCIAKRGHNTGGRGCDMGWRLRRAPRGKPPLLVASSRRGDALAGLETSADPHSGSPGRTPRCGKTDSRGSGRGCRSWMIPICSPVSDVARGKPLRSIHDPRGGHSGRGTSFSGQFLGTGLSVKCAACDVRRVDPGNLKCRSHTLIFCRWYSMGAR